MRARSPHAFTLLLPALALAAIGAGGSSPATSSGTTSGSSSSSTSGAGGSVATFGTSACGVCVHAGCTSAIMQCSADPECTTWLACLDACPITSGGDADPACVAACPAGSGSAALAAESAVTTCRTSGAGAQCDACGHGPVLHDPYLNQKCTPSTDPNPCFKCEDSKCCDTESACHANADCQAFKTCVAACPQEKGCLDGCGAQHADGVALFAPLWACSVYWCASEETSCNVSKRDHCQECLYHTCGDIWADEASTADGFLVNACIQDCAVGDAACDDACLKKYPKAQPLLDKVATCVNMQCKGC